MSENTTRGRGGSIVGLIFIGLGIIFALGQIFQVNFLQFFWPFFVIVPGLMFFVGMVAAGKPGGPLAIPGSIVTTVGLILLFDSLTGMWHNWAYVWALIFPTSIGAGMVIAGRWSDSREMRANGRRVFTIGAIIFLAFGAFFELVLNISRNPVVPYLWPALMIVVGVLLLLRRTGQAAQGSEARMAESMRPPHIPAPSRPTPPTPPSAPTPPKAPKAPPMPAAPQFEPLDSARGKKKAKQPAAPKGEPDL